MSTGMAYLCVFLFIGVLGILDLIVGLLFDNTNSKDDKTIKKNNNTIRKNAPNKIKCRCMECGQIVMVPKQYLKDLTYYGPQTAKCPNCNWKMRKVEIIQTRGLH